jgi:hypothetical protein
MLLSYRYNLIYNRQDGFKILNTFLLTTDYFLH